VVRWGVLAVVVTVIAWEYAVSWSGGWPSVPMHAYPNGAAVAALRDDPTIRAVFNIPSGHLLTAKDGMIYQTHHHKPLIAGHVTRRTPVSPAKLNVLERTLNPALLRSVGADAVLLHRAWADADGVLEAFARDQLGEPLSDDGAVVVWRVPSDATPPAFVAVTPSDGRHTGEWSAYAYAPEPMWATFSATLGAVRQPVTLALDGVPVHEWFVDGANTVQLRLPLSGGFHAVTLDVMGECPRLDTDALTCRYVDATGVTLTAVEDAPLTSPFVWAGGVALDVGTVTAGADGVTVSLLWTFADGLDDQTVRFVALVDADGNAAGGDDRALGTFEAGASWAESVTVDVAAGTYTAYIGWYTYPDLTRLDVLTDVPEAVNRWVLIGTATVGGGE
jgi:hypothetical protein